MPKPKKKKDRKTKVTTLKVGADIDDIGWESYTWPPDTVKIDVLTPFGYAEQKNYKVGDVLIKVNDIPIADITTKKELKKYMKERPVNFTFERQKKKKKAG